MTKTIFALGGGSIGEHCDTYTRNKPEGAAEYHPAYVDPVYGLIAAASRQSNPKVLLLSTPSEDGLHNVDLFLKALERELGRHGCQTTVLKIIESKPTVGQIASQIASADLIYVSGGNTFRAMRSWRSLGVDKILKQAYDSGVVMSGVSAGAICWFKYGCSNSFYTNRPFRVRGMGWFNALLCPHYDSEPFRQEPLRRMLKRTPGLVGIALGEHAAIEIVDEDRYRFHTYGPSSQIKVVRYKSAPPDNYICDEIKPSVEYQPLKQLLGPV